MLHKQLKTNSAIIILTKPNTYYTLLVTKQVQCAVRDSLSLLQRNLKIQLNQNGHGKLDLIQTQSRWNYSPIGNYLPKPFFLFLLPFLWSQKYELTLSIPLAFLISHRSDMYYIYIFDLSFMLLILSRFL